MPFGKTFFLFSETFTFWQNFDLPLAKPLFVGKTSLFIG
jgi:hypothetical protein